jgi:glycine C-acetyltransferase/8-amino-7-oxononanoate synthase
MAALELLQEEPRRVEKLQRNGDVLRQALADNGLPAAPGETQILPVVIGKAGDAVAASERALEKGVFAQAIRPPTVPEGTSRLRLTVMASHTKSELRDAAKTLASALPGSVRKAAARRVLQAPESAVSGRVYDGLADAA